MRLHHLLLPRPKPHLLRLSPSWRRHFSDLSSPQPHPHGGGGGSHRDEHRRVRVAVWWDFENCNVPGSVNVLRVAPAIAAALRANGIKGPIEITAFGDMAQLSRSKQEGLSCTGVNLTHIPRDGKNSSDRSVLLSIMYWVSHNPPPAHLFLISSDKDFASTLHRLRMKNYNILLATQECPSPVLCSAASIMWNWYDLLHGEKLAGKYFNQPPDGPFGSWYGHYKVPLLDPYSTDVEPSCEESHEPEVNSVDVPTPLVPKGIIRQIRLIVESRPKGISTSELRNELASNLSLDKEYYGYKKFIPFLLSLKNIVRLKRIGDGNYIASAASQYNHDDEEEDCDGKFVKNGSMKPDYAVSPSPNPPSDINDKGRPINRQKNSLLDENTITMANASDGHLPPMDDDKIERDGKSVEIDIKPASDNQLPLGDENIVESVTDPGSSSGIPVVVQEESSSEPGIFKRWWGLFFGSKRSSASDNKSRKGEEVSEGNESEKDPKLTVGSADRSLHIETPSSEASTDKTVTKLGLLDRIQNWFMSASDIDKLSNCSSAHEVFSQDLFWISMESFMDSSRGSLIVSESRTRKQMANNLQRKGPECLNALQENDLLHLVDLLISEKNWVEESPSKVFPFKLTRAGKTSPLENHPSTTTTTTSLSYLFASQPGMKSLLNHKRKGTARNTLNGVGQEVPLRSNDREKNPLMSEDKVITNCRNLLNELVKEHPAGFFIGSFTEHFFRKYGYQLDYKVLGYPVLTDLLESFPGVKVNSCQVMRCNNNSFLHHQENGSRRSASVASKNGNGLDSPWEELGPVDSTKSSKESKMVVESEDNLPDVDYEPDESEDEFSDLGEVCHVQNKKLRSKNEDSSLLQILDTWHSRNEGGRSKNKSECLETELDEKLGNPKKYATDRDKLMPAKNPSPNKGYSFVLDSDSDDTNVDKLTNNILQNLKTSKNDDKVLCQ